ncbi:MAG TPA: GTP cyclohydrolase I, partial [Saprospiraceae bacterium]|nr:GTP cyclohydrolase I [Saprospiraceae bacterium]
MAYKKKDFYDEEVTSSISEMFSGMINTLGEDASREGLVKTPERAAKAMQFLTQGYQQDAGAILKSALFKEDYNEMVVVKDIELYS